MSKKGRRPDFTLRSPYSSHPGYDQEYQPYSEPAARRIKSAAESNYIRNRGTMGLFLQHDHPQNEGYESARPVPKARSDLAANILNRSVNGSLGSLVGTSSNMYAPDYSVPIYQQRVRGAAAEIADYHRGQMGDVIGNGACFCPAPAQSKMPVPRIKQAALNTAEMHRGGAMGLLIHSYGKLELDPQPVPRIKRQAGDNADLGTKGNVGKLFYGELEAPPQPQPRVKAGAEDIMKKNRGAFHQLMQHAGYTPTGYSYYNQLSDRPSSAMM